MCLSAFISFSFIRFIYFYIDGYLPTCMCVHQNAWCPQRPEDATSPETGLTSALKLNLGPQEEKPVLITDESSFLTPPPPPSSCLHFLLVSPSNTTVASIATFVDIRLQLLWPSNIYRRLGTLESSRSSAPHWLLKHPATCIRQYQVLFLSSTLRATAELPSHSCASHSTESFQII